MKKSSNAILKIRDTDKTFQNQIMFFKNNMLALLKKTLNIYSILVYSLFKSMQVRCITIHNINNEYQKYQFEKIFL